MALGNNGSVLYGLKPAQVTVLTVGNVVKLSLPQLKFSEESARIES
jgi:hypothetical protein